jgi:hypothetical protein
MLEFTRQTTQVDTRRCEECVALGVVTGEVSYRRSDLIGVPFAAAIVAVSVVCLGEEGRWYAEVREEERKLMVCLVLPRIPLLRCSP